VNLAATYQRVCQSLVAIAVKTSYAEHHQRVPIIIGSGFVVGDGLVATNDHVIQQARNLQNQFGCPENEWPFSAVMFCLDPKRGMGQLRMEVLGAFTLEGFVPGQAYYGPPKPDLGFLHVNMRGLPALEIAPDASLVPPGAQVATAGFPMGTDALTAPGYVHQLCPTLQQGIVSAVLPFSCSTPHALLLNMMSQGGASGSPIFLPESGQVVGVLYGGLQERYHMNVQGVSVPYNVPTNFTYCLPSHFIVKALASVHSQSALTLPSNAPHLDEPLSHLRDLADGSADAPKV
jgi:S1-C subfamily serine protease